VQEVMMAIGGDDIYAIKGYLAYMLEMRAL